MRTRFFYLFLFVGFLLSIVLSATPSFAASSTLYVSVYGSGSGTVVAEGVNCGTDCQETYDYICFWFFCFPPTENITYSVTSGSFFAGWSGDCAGTGTCSLKMDSDRHVTATFNLSSFNLTATAGIGGSIDPAGSTSVLYGNS